MSSRTLHVLVAGSDESLEDEVRSAVGALPRARCLVHTAPGLREGAEAARNRAPDLVVVPLSTDLDALRAFTRDVEFVAPEAVVVGAYHADLLRAEGSEDSLLIGALRARIRDFVRRPLSSTEFQEIVDRYVGGTATARGRAGRIVSFVSNKGGVGKSTVSVNAACALARRHPGRVLLVDASLQLGVCASALDMDPPTTIVDAVHELSRLDETLLREIAVRHSSGLHLLAAPMDAVEATAVGEVEISRILSVGRRAFDYVIVDTFPLLDAVAVAILDLSELCFSVTSGTVPNVIGMARFLDVIERLGVPRARQRVVLNSPQPRFSGALTPEDVATRLGRPIDFVLPFDKKVLITLNSGEPIGCRAPGLFGFGRALQRLVDACEDESRATAAARGAPSSNGAAVAAGAPQLAADEVRG